MQSQTPSFPPRFTQSHPDPPGLTQICCLNEILAISQRFAQPQAILHTPTQIHPISLRFALTHSDSCNLTQTCSASCSFSQTRSDSQNFTQIHSDLPHKLSLRFIQIRSDLIRFAQFRSDSSRFTKIYSHLLRQAPTGQSWREKGNAPGHKGKREGGRTHFLTLIQYE